MNCAPTAASLETVLAEEALGDASTFARSRSKELLHVLREHVDFDIDLIARPPRA